MSGYVILEKDIQVGALGREAKLAFKGEEITLTPVYEGDRSGWCGQFRGTSVKVVRFVQDTRLYYYLLTQEKGIVASFAFHVAEKLRQGNGSVIYFDEKESGEAMCQCYPPQMVAGRDAGKHAFKHDGNVTGNMTRSIKNVAYDFWEQYLDMDD